MFNWLGIQSPTSHGEHWAAGCGAVISLLLIGSVSYSTLGLQGSAAIVPSMGAAAVLLFALPHGTLSQPWALFCGNLVSAFIGVTVALWVPHTIMAAGLAVGLAIAAMYLLRCIHPPGGATALAAVIGGDTITGLGYHYLLIPVMLNCFILFCTALAFNNLFPWRRYPATLMRYSPLDTKSARAQISQQQIQRAMDELGVTLDVSATQLQQIYSAAKQHQQRDIASGFNLKLGGVYGNNRPGAHWSVRKIIDYADHPDPAKQLVIYKVIDGAQKNTADSCTRAEFGQWAAHELNSAEG